MVAACATTSSAAAAAAPYQTGFTTIFGGCENKGQPTATAASDHQNNKTVEVMMAAVMVDQLRQQLQLVVENDDLSAAIACIGQLENAIFNKETLEATRIGRYVNEIRRQTAQQWPDFSKRCRALIKQWQKIAEYRPSSSCEGSSNGGTPQLVSPALRRGLTPRTTTPGKRSTPQQQQLQQRVISTELQPPTEAHQITGPSSISPVENGIAVSGGSYAPLSQSTFRKKISPQLATIVEQHQQQQQFLHKSASVGATLCHLESGKDELHHSKEETILNGIVLAVDISSGGKGPSADTNSAAVGLESAAVVQSQNPPLTLKLKRSASGVQRLTTTAADTDNGGVNANTTAQQQSVHAARKDVQSTAMLVAQLALPQHIGIIDLGTKTNESVVKCDETPSTNEQNIITRVSPDLPASSTQDLRCVPNKRRYSTRNGGRDAPEEAIEMGSIKQVKIGEEEARTAEVSVSEEKEEKMEGKEKAKKGKGRKKKDDDPSTTIPSKFNWFDEYPLTSGDNDQPSTSTEGESRTDTEIAQARAVPTRSFVLSARDRQVVLLPYVDIGLPDWKTHGLPNPERFLFPDQSEWASGPP